MYLKSIHSDVCLKKNGNQTLAMIIMYLLFKYNNKEIQIILNSKS